jgi:hypothetical protein
MAGELSAVEFEETSPIRPSLFIDTVSLQNLLAAIFLFSLLFLAHLLSTILGPESHQTIQEISHFTNRSINVPLDIDLSLSSLRSSFGFFTVTATFIRTRTSTNQSHRLNVSLQKLHSRQGNVSSFMAVPRKEYTLLFKVDSFHSQEFVFFQDKIGGFDRTDLRVSLESDFSDVEGCLFEISMLSDGVLRHGRCLKMIGSVVVVWTAFLSGVWKSDETDSFGRLFLFLISISSIFASNPLFLIFCEKTIDDLLFTQFLWFFRFFLLCEMDGSRSGFVSLRLGLTAIIFAGSIAAAVAEAHELPQTATIHPIVFYWIFLAIMIVVSALRSERPFVRRVVVFSGCAIGEVVVDWCVRSGIFAEPIRQETIHAGFAMIAAALSLFVLRRAGREDYRAISVGETEDPSFDVDALSEESTQGMDLKI